MNMNDTIVSTLKMYYGVSECVVYEKSEERQIEVMCVGGDVDFVCIALKQICDSDSVDLVLSDKDKYLFRVNL